MTWQFILTMSLITVVQSVLTEVLKKLFPTRATLIESSVNQVADSVKLAMDAQNKGGGSNG